MMITRLSSILFSFALLAQAAKQMVRAQHFERALVREQGFKRFSRERRYLYQDHDSREGGYDGFHGGHRSGHGGHHGHDHYHPHSYKSSKFRSKSKSKSKSKSNKYPLKSKKYPPKSKFYPPKSKSQSKSHSKKKVGPPDIDVQARFDNINKQARVAQEAEDQK